VVEMLAWCGAALSCLLAVPQAIRVLRAERLDGISASTYVIVLSNAAVWAAWSLLTGENAAGIPGLINGPAAILILHRLMIARHERRTTSQIAARSYAARNPLNMSPTPGVLTGSVAEQTLQHHVSMMNMPPGPGSREVEDPVVEPLSLTSRTRSCGNVCQMRNVASLINSSA
jgi:uncharacterized protein with PQ loop repeat